MKKIELTQQEIWQATRPSVQRSKKEYSRKCKKWKKELSLAVAAFAFVLNCGAQSLPTYREVSKQRLWQINDSLQGDRLLEFSVIQLVWTDDLASSRLDSAIAEARQHRMPSTQDVSVYSQTQYSADHSCEKLLDSTWAYAECASTWEGAVCSLILITSRIRTR